MSKSLYASMSWHVEVSAIERRFHGNLPRHDGPERLTRTNVDSTSFCYVCVYMLVFTYPLFNHRKDIYIYMLDLLFLSPHAMLTHCGFVFKRIMSRRKVIPVNLVLQSTFFFFNFFHVSLAQSCPENIWKTFPCCTWWIADDRRGSQVWLVSSARLRLCLHRMWP